MAKTLHSLKDLKGLIPKDEPVRPAVKAKHSEKQMGFRRDGREGGGKAAQLDIRKAQARRFR